MTIGEEPARDRRAKPGAATAPDDGAGHDLSISLESRAGFTQIVDFDVPGLEPFVIDEPPPLGAGGGPNPARVLAAVGGCLATSLLLASRSSRTSAP